MTIKMNTDILGIEDVRRDLRRMERELKKKISKKVRVATNYMRDRLRENTPKDTGKLRKNTKTTVRGNSGAVVVGADAWYFLVVNYGSEARGLPATEYAEKTVAKYRRKTDAILIEGVDEVLRGG